MDGRHSWQENISWEDPNLSSYLCKLSKHFSAFSRLLRNYTNSLVNADSFCQIFCSFFCNEVCRKNAFEIYWPSIVNTLWYIIFPICFIPWYFMAFGFSNQQTLNSRIYNIGHARTKSVVSCIQFCVITFRA